MTSKSQRPVGRKALTLLLPLALLLALLAISTSGAQAATAHFYCGTVLPPLGTCNGGAHTNLQGNVALYPGKESSLLVCQQIFDNTVGKYIAASCGVNGTGGESNALGSLGHSLTPFVQNGSSENAHTVNGDWFSP